MATKKRIVKKRQTNHDLLADVEARVEALERDSKQMRNEMGKLTEELGALRVTVHQVDERTRRGEKLLMHMQGEQRQMSKTLDRIADHLHVPPPPSDPEPIPHS